MIQLALTSQGESLAQVYECAQCRIRQTLTQVPGSALPSPYSGAPRQVMVDLDLNALAGYGLTPMDLKITPLFDQLVFVSGAIDNVIREALIASALTGGMILMFLGLWRSTIVVPVSIPLSILCSLIAMTALGETINIMTLGGLALAVGILVDEATVAIENTYRMMEQGRPFLESVVESAAGIATPALISTLAISSAFVSVFLLTETPKYLFTPQGLAVVFAMLPSYGLSRTVVPILIDVLVAKEYAQRHPDKAKIETTANARRRNRASPACAPRSRR